MEEKLRGYLRPDEEVYWENQPNDFPLLDGGNRVRILRKWVLEILVAGGVLIGHVTTNAKTEMGLVVLLAGVVLLGLYMPFQEKRKLMQCRYWITDQRVIQMTKDQLFYSMELDQVDRFRVAKDGRATCLLLGSGVFDDAAKLMRWRAATPKKEREGGGRSDQADGLIFYGVDNVEAAAELLKRRGCEKAA